MIQRLSEEYGTGDQVDIYLHGRWQPARVIGLAHPGLWVESRGQRWYVTNRKHIRPGGHGADAFLPQCPER